MRMITLANFLIGRRAAIEEVATHPSSPRIGFLFVIAAGLAREYDQEDLVHQPWHVLLPLLASAALAGIFAALMWMMRPKPDAHRPSILAAWRMFISLLWMMSPMAWLYAVPYERMLDAGDATRMNMSTLAIVAAWRLLLMTRVLVVALGLRPAQAFVIVMAIADALALFGLMIVPLPLFSIMGGMRLNESEQLIASARMQVTILGTLTLPVWAIGALAAMVSGRPDWRRLDHDVLWADDATTKCRGLQRLAVAAALAGLLLLPWAQAEQQRRWRVESHLRDGRVAEAVEFMSEHERSAFPPHWDPPPRLGYGQREPRAEVVVEAIRDHGSADWVRETYLVKLDSQLRDEIAMYGFDQEWPRIETFILDDDRGMTSSVKPHLESLRMLLAMHVRMKAEDRDAVELIIHRLEGKPEAP